MGIFDDLFDKAKAFFGESSEGAAQIQKRCYYELLEVPRDSTEDEIKRSYKKLALKYHPDKSPPEKKEECTAYFILLQQAYEVLTDPQEKAFYDKHRENIIRGSSAEERKDTGINLYKFFQKCYNGYGDDEDGFFSIYRQLFDTLASEEFPYIEDDEDKDFPSFGQSESDYDQVVAPFYDLWTSFSTQRSFAWLDRYNLKEAPDRYTLKCMDKENKKFRDVGKKQRNEEIRTLVQYVRKRDPRVKVYREQLEEKKKKEMERVEQARKDQILRNLRKINDQEVESCLHDDNYLDQLDQIETQLDEEFGVFAIDENGEEDPDSYYCIACEKRFNKSKAFTNHQKTNKHKQAVEALKKLMAEDEEELLGNNEKDDGDSDQSEEDNEEEETSNERKATKSKATTSGKKSKKNNKKGKSAKKNKSSEDDEEEENDGDSDLIENEEKEEEENVGKKKGKKSKNTKKPTAPTISGGATIPVESSCMICNETFSSRSKLFDHIKATGHAALKQPTMNAAATKSVKKKGKR